MLASVGLKPGYAWCAAFVSFVFGKAGVKTGPARHRYRVKAWADWAWAEGKLYYSSPKRGDLFYWINDDGTGHIGFVLNEPGMDATLRTIEGNTNSAGSREGDGVYKKPRPMTKRLRYIRWA